SCMPAGLPADMPCPPGERQQSDGRCVPAGVPPGGCGDGFAQDRERSCAPVLPADPCPAGMMAVPGEPECRDIAPCGAGTWGDIPTGADTQYVDQSYPGTDSDGSVQRPWRMLGNAVAATASGAIIAIAAGSYVEDVVIQGKSVRLWGKCPKM